MDENKLKKSSELETTEFEIADDESGVDNSVINSFLSDQRSLKLLKQTEGIEDENDLAATRIYKVMRPGEPVTKDAAHDFVLKLFFHPEKIRPYKGRSYEDES